MPYPLAANSRPVNELISRGLAGLANGDGKYIAQTLLPANINGMGGTFAQQAARAATGTIQRLANFSMFGDAAAGAAIDRARLATFHRSKGFGLDPLEFTVRSFSGEAQTAMEDLTDVQLGTTGEFDAKKVALAVEMETLLLHLELYVANLMQTAANWSNTFAVVNKWGAASDDPMADINKLIDYVEAYGPDCTDLVIPRLALLKLRTSPGFREYLPTTLDRTSLTNDRIKDIIISNTNSIKRVHFGRARYNTSKNPEVPVFANCWADTLWAGTIAQGEKDGVAVGGDQNKIKLSPTAAQRVVVEDFRVSEYPEENTNSIVSQIISRQWAGKVNMELGATATAVTA